jgi:hypothetical protein
MLFHGYHPTRNHTESSHTGHDESTTDDRVVRQGRTSAEGKDATILPFRRVVAKA